MPNNKALKDGTAGRLSYQLRQAALGGLLGFALKRLAPTAIVCGLRPARQKSVLSSVQVPGCLLLRMFTSLSQLCPYLVPDTGRVPGPQQ